MKGDELMLYLLLCVVVDVWRVQRITAEMHSLYSVSSISQTQSAQIVGVERRLQSAVVDDNIRLHKVHRLFEQHPISNIGVIVCNIILQFSELYLICWGLKVKV